MCYGMGCPFENCQGECMRHGKERLLPCPEPEDVFEDEDEDEDEDE